MTQNSLTLSIVIPAFNEQAYLPACLDSIAAQTVRPNEVIVVDNDSTDETAKIAKSYPFVKLIREKKKGVVFARNRGFNAARSHLIARIDADTTLPINWVEEVKILYEESGRPDLYAATAPPNFRNRFSLVCYFLHRFTYFWPSRFILGHNTLVGSNMFITKKLWLLLHTNVCLRNDIHEDMDLAFHAAAQEGVDIVFSTKFKAFVLSRSMLSRLISYPAMMIRIRLIEH